MYLSKLLVCLLLRTANSTDVYDSTRLNWPLQLAVFFFCFLSVEKIKLSFAYLFMCLFEHLLAYLTTTTTTVGNMGLFPSIYCRLGFPGIRT